MESTYPPEIDAYVRDQLDSAEYASEHDLIVDAIRMHRELRTRHQQLRDDIRVGIESLDRGEGAPLDMDAIKAEVAERFNRRSDAS